MKLDYKMPKTEINIDIIGNDRKTIRDALIIEFLKEEPGTGNGENTSVYYYFVEKTTSGIGIYLKRPARLNKGMDFEVNAKNIVFENKSQKGRITRTSRPSHSTISYDLKQKKVENPIEYKKVKSLIEKIYNSSDITNAEYLNINFTTGHPIELVLKMVKWLFIEQDITYWNWSGRKMFYSGLIEI